MRALFGSRASGLAVGAALTWGALGAQAGEPAVSAERKVGEPVPAPVDGRCVAVTHAAVGYLAAWVDRRSGVDGVYATRLGAEGGPLEPNAIRIDASGEGPAVASDGSGYLVVYDDDEGLKAVPLGPGGEVGSPIVVAGAALRASVASEGSGYLVVFQTALGEGSDVMAQRLGLDGAPVGPPIAIAAGPGEQGSAFVTRMGDRYLVAWVDEAGRLLGARVEATGGVLDPNGVELAPLAGIDTFGRGVGLASDGANLLATWEVPVANVLARRFGPDLLPLAAAQAFAGPAMLDSSPTAAFDGSGYVIAWENADLSSDVIYAARVAPDGTTVAQPKAVYAGETFERALSSNGAQTLIAWRGAGPVFAERLDASLAPLDAQPFALSQAPNSQSAPAVSWGGTGFVAVWQDLRGIYASPLGPDGAALAPGGVGLAASGVAPQAALTASGVVAAWQRLEESGYSGESTLLAARLAPDGTTLDTTPLEIGLSGVGRSVDWFALASHPTQARAFVAYQQDDASQISVLGAFVSPDGSVSNRLELYAGRSPGGVVAFDGAGYLVVLKGDNRSVALRVSEAGAIEGGPIELDPLSACPGGPLALSSDGAGFELVCGGLTGTLEAVRLGPTGEPLGKTVALPRVHEGRVSSAFDGTHHVVAWTTDAGADESPSVVVARISITGALVDTAARPITTAPVSASTPALAAGPPGHLLVAYERPDLALGVSRVFTRSWDAECAPATDGSACDDGDPCTLTDACTGGRCVGTVDASCTVGPGQGGAGGAGGASGAGAAPGAESEGDDGCGCRVVTPRGPGWVAVLAGLVVAGGVLRRRRAKARGARRPPPQHQ